MVATALLSVLLVACGQLDVPPTAPSITKHLPPTAVTAQETTSVLADAAQNGQVAQPAKPVSDTVSPCTFMSAIGTEPSVPPLENYRFDPPKLLLLAQTLGIAGWLPDNRCVLITHQVDGPNSLSVVETFDTETGASQHYADADPLGKPVWLADDQAVLYRDDVDKGSRSVVRLARGNNAPPQELVSDLGNGFFSISRDGTRMMFTNKMNVDQVHVRTIGRGVTQERTLLPAVVAPLRLLRREAQADYRGFSTTWHPDGNQLILSNTQHTYLLNVATGALCTITLKTTSSDHVWARRSEWSADGRFLALLVAHGEDLPTQHIDLQLIDTTNGRIQQINLPTPLIFDVAWARNGRQLLALGKVATDSTGYSLLGLFAIDAQRGTSRRVLPEQTFGVGAFTNQGGGLAWSDDGQRLVTNCLVWSDDKKAVRGDRLCRVDIHAPAS